MANNYSSQSSRIFEPCYLFSNEIQMVTGFPSITYHISYVITLIFNIALTMLTISLNSVTILAYHKSVQLKRKKPYFLLTLLSVCDLMTGLFANTSHVLVLITMIIDYPRCWIYFVSEYTIFQACSMSLTTVFALNVERYLCILHPFYHHTKVTKSKLLKTLIAVWLFIIPLYSGYLAFGEVMNFVISALILFIACSTLYIYIAIWTTGRKRQLGEEAPETRRRNTATRVSEEQTSQTNDLKNRKMAKSCSIVVAMTYFCFLPNAVTRALTDSYFVNLLSIWSVSLVLSSSSLNSLIFFWNNPILRKEAKKLFQNLVQ